MALARWERPALIENAAGYLVLGGAVYCEVRTEAAGNALADLFEDRDGLTPLANPFLASDGVPGFHVAGGSYQVRLYKTGYDFTPGNVERRSKENRNLRCAGSFFNRH